MSTKHILGIVAVLLTALAYVPYFQSLLTRRTKPHLFSWIVWTLLGGVSYGAQLVKGAGAGSWMLGFTTMLCAIITLIAFIRGEKNILRSDWVAFLGALLAIVVWCVTQDPLWAVIIAGCINMLACYLTLRKSFSRPWDESALSYTLQALRAVFSFTALESYSVVTMLPIFVFIFSNGLLAATLFWRRRIMAGTHDLSL